ncbi:MFS transporter [Kitasatospora sp. NPDC101183]|uniref:MFS transporter n=1 Tax=Kitasatospora sp. NPDC101183 TaxID=3364100 RepID=UPI00380DF90E
MSDGFRPPTRVALLALTCIGQFMVLLNNTITSAALPDMQKRLDTSLTGLQWIVNAYVLAVAMLLLAGGVFADRFGGKRVFLGGMAVFTVASLLCSLSASVGWLLAARVLQGIGAAALSPASLALLASGHPSPRDRVKAIGQWATFSGIGLAVGPAAGGILVEAFDWRAIFLINIPIGLVTLAVGARILPDSRNPEAPPLDLPGQVLALLVVGTLAFGLTEAGDQGWTAPPILGCFGATVVLLALFLVVEARAARPMLPLRLFRLRLFTVSNAAMIVVGFGLMGSGFFFTQFFATVQSHSVMRSAMETLPCTVAMVACSPYAARAATRFGFRAVVTVGLVLAGGGLVTMAAVQADTPYLNVWWRLAVTGIGFGLTMSPLTGATISSVSRAEGGLASGISSTTRQIGAVFGVAVLGAVVRTRQEHGASYGSGLNTAFLVAGAVTLLSAVLTGLWLVQRRSPEPEAPEITPTRTPQPTGSRS